MEPTIKSSGIETFLNSLGFGNRKESITNNVCVFCKQLATEFRDEMSVQEFKISGICQKCQDATFGKK